MHCFRCNFSILTETGVVFVLKMILTLSWIQTRYTFLLFNVNSCFQTLTNDSNCISHRTNTLGEGMNPIILPPAMGK